MVISTQEGGPGSGSSSWAGTERIDEWMWEFISSEITCGILKRIPMIFGLVNEGILELLDGRLEAF